MSAIVALYHLDGRPIDPETLREMRDRLAHRGPDGAGLWHHGPIGLGHRMLWTTPESPRERLPLVDEAGSLVLTADARIDNRDELIASLGLSRHRSRELGDSELILRAYQRWGEACPAKLLGDFAFALWDGHRGVLFCARDPMGVKPFYYHQAPRLFACASEIKALLSLAEVPRRLNEARIGDYLLTDFEDKTTTFYQDIHRLPPGHQMTVTPDGARIHPYWSPDPQRELPLRDEREYVEAFRELFTEAVRCRLRSPSPPGAMLSGGLDSSSIACVAARILSQAAAGPLHTFSAIFPSLAEADRRIDERRYIDAVLATGGFQPHYVHADALSPLIDLLWREEEAIPAPSLYMDQAIFQAARGQGLRVLLSGFDGDTTVSYGYEYLEELARTGRWRRLLDEATALARNLGVPRQRVIWHLGIRPLAPEWMIALWRRARRRSPEQPITREIIHPDLIQRLRERPRSRHDNGSSPRVDGRLAHYQALTSGLLTYALEVLDKAAAPLALEIRYPFFDRRLIEFCLALPLEQKLRHGWPRAILRQAMQGVLPPQVQYRLNKGNLSANFKRKLLDQDRERLDEVIRDPPDPLRAYVHLPALRAAYHRYIAEPLAREEEAVAVFLAAVLALWFRRS